MRKIIVFLFFITSLSCITNSAKAEIVEIEKDEETFGDWKVYCETDVMMDNSHCKIASKFFDSSSVITIEPTAKFFNQLFIIIPQIKIGSFVKIRIDQNDLILSDNIKDDNFGLISLNDSKKNDLYHQMKDGDFLFFRFNVRDSEKELTIKISLKDFRNALDYYNSRVFPQ
jgi:invasion protein IalB